MNLANSYTEADSTLAIPMDRLGLYEYVITVPGKQLTVSNRFSVSRLAALTRSQTNNPEVLCHRPRKAVNRSKGQPLSITKPI